MPVPTSSFEMGKRHTAFSFPIVFNPLICKARRTVSAVQP